MVRHGQASVQSEDYDKLSPLGELQAGIFGQYLAKEELTFDAVFTGTMLRHQQTADNALTHLPATNIETSAKLNELDHKDVLAKYDSRYATTAGMLKVAKEQQNPKRFFMREFNQAINRWTSGQHCSDYNESWSEFTTRIQAGIAKLTEKLADPKLANSNILVFSSGGPISLFACHALGIPMTQFLTVNHTLVNAGVSKFIVDKSGKLKLSTLNYHQYFEQPHLTHTAKELITYT